MRRIATAPGHILLARPLARSQHTWAGLAALDHLGGHQLGATPDQEITLLLRRAQDGDRVAFDEVYQIVYEELRGVARAVRSRHRSDTLNTTALVHEAYLKLVPAPTGVVQDRVHFFSIATRAMRQVLVDAARKRVTAKRGGDGAAFEYYEGRHSVSTSSVSAEDVIALDSALDELEERSQRQARVVEYRIFGGLSVPETAKALGVSEPTVKRDWQTARAFLAHLLRAGPNRIADAGLDPD